MALSVTVRKVGAKEGPAVIASRDGDSEHAGWGFDNNPSEWSNNRRDQPAKPRLSALSERAFTITRWNGSTAKSEIEKRRCEASSELVRRY